MSTPLETIEMNVRPGGRCASHAKTTFTDLGEQTEMETHFAGLTTDQMFELSQKGWETQIDKLAEYVARG